MLTQVLGLIAIVALTAAAVFVWLWSTLAVWYTAPLPPRVRHGIALLFAGAVPVAFVTAPLVIAAGTFFLVSVAILVRFLAIEPSNDGNWRPEVAVLPFAEIQPDRVVVHNVRNLDWQDRSTFRTGYYAKSFQAADLQGTDLLVSHFVKSDRVAHTMLSWDFGGEDVLCLSIEIRREKGAGWGALPGMFKQFEIVYILGDERDLVRSRVTCRDERMYMFRLGLSEEQSWRLLTHILEHINRLRDRPEFYRTVLRNCTTAVVDHVNAIWPRRTPYFKKMMMNGYAAEQAWERGLIPNDVPFAAIREQSLINDAVRAAADAPDFSRRIRARVG